MFFFLKKEYIQLVRRRLPLAWLPPRSDGHSFCPVTVLLLRLPVRWCPSNIFTSAATWHPAARPSRPAPTSAGCRLPAVILMTRRAPPQSLIVPTSSVSHCNAFHRVATACCRCWLSSRSRPPGGPRRHPQASPGLCCCPHLLQPPLLGCWSSDHHMLCTCES